MVTERTDVEAGPPSSGETALRRHIADIIMSYATKNGAIGDSTAYRQVSAVTGRAVTTVRNWLLNRTFFPDIPSLARISSHWGIPPEAFFPADVISLLNGDEVPRAQDTEALDALRRASGSEQPLLSLYGAIDALLLDRALSRYTEHPRSTVLVRYPLSDMQDQIRPGELIVVDPTVEQIDGIGMYYLRFSSSAGAEKTCVRLVEPLMSSPAIRLSCGSALPPTSIETLELVDGSLPSSVTVLGRVVAVVRQT